jgi:hypothetical protein
MSMHLKNEGQECETGPARAQILAWLCGQMKTVKENEYGPGTLYTCMKIEQ